MLLPQYFLDILKSSVVIPIRKKALRKTSLSLVPVILNIFEYIMKDQLSLLFEEHKIFSSAQYGFRNSLNIDDC